MRIAHVITRFIRGGADENTLLSCNGQAELGHDVTIVIGGEADVSMLQALSPRVRVIRMPDMVREISPYRDVLSLIAMIRLFRQLKPDIVHTHNSKAGVVGRVAAALSGNIAVHTVHIAAFMGEHGSKRALYRILEAICVRFCRALIFVSEGLREAFLDAVDPRSVPSYVVKSGMDLSRFRRRPDAPFEGDPGAPASRRVTFLYAGAFEARKRVVQLIQCLGEAGDKEGWSLIMAGSGPLEGEVRACIQSYGLEKNIELVGFDENLGKRLAEVDAMVLASTIEGLPRVVVQSLAVGTPVICHDLPGAEKIVQHGCNAMVIPGSDTHRLVKAMLELTRSRSLLNQLRAGAMQFDASAWSSERMVRRLEEIYRLVLTSHDRGDSVLES